MDVDALLISDVQAAALCGCSRSHWHALAAAGKIPPSIKLGRKRLWRRAEIESWILAGCPSGDVWAAMQAAAGRRLKLSRSLETPTPGCHPASGTANEVTTP